MPLYDVWCADLCDMLEVALYACLDQNGGLGGRDRRSFPGGGSCQLGGSCPPSQHCVCQLP